MASAEINSLSNASYLKAILGSIDDAVVATDENLVVQYWNEKAVQVFGRTAEQAVGQSASEVLPMKNEPGEWDQIRNSVRATGVWKSPVPFSTSAGDPRLLEATVTAISGTQGAVTGYVAVYRDNTDCANAQTSLSAFLTFMSTAGDYFFVVDKDLQLAFTDEHMSQRLEETFGYSCSVGECVLDKIPPERREEVRSCYKLALQGGKINYERQLDTRNGKKIWVQASYFPVKDAGDQITHACLLARDITPQKRVEEVNEILYNSRKVFEIFMENSPIMSWITNIDGVIKYLNPSFLRTYHITKAAIGKPLSTVFPEHVAALFRENDAIVYQAKQAIRVNESYIAPNGAKRTYQVVKFPVETEEGVFIGGWAIDITDENELRKSLSESLVKLKSSEQELKEALTKEHHLNELKSRFVSMASHEFRTPLSTMLSSIYLLEKYTTTEQQPNRLKHSAKIKEAIQHLNSLLEDFLTLGKLEEGKTAVTNSPFDLHKLLHETIEELEPIKKCGQVVHLSYTGNDNIVSDKKIIKNIMVNLLNNAIKFSAEKDVIWLEAKNEKEQLSITVKDEGIGISKADQEHLFQTFFRGRNAQNIQGTGLGLNIVRRYLEMLNGTISLQSELDSGTTVSFTIPLQS